MKSKSLSLIYCLLSSQFFLLMTCCEEPQEIQYIKGQSGTMTDIEGNVYKTITIGTQTWMAENLKTTLLNDSSSILENCSHIITAMNDSGYVNVLTTGYCWYNNISDTTRNHLGALYNFYAVNTGKLCPAGWHVPGETEWNIMIDFLGGKNIAGGKLKHAGQRYWDNPNKGASNETGFNSLPGGKRYSSRNTFSGIRQSGYWWTNTSKNSWIAVAKSMSYHNTEVLNYDFLMTTACSVRCIKDEN